MSFSERYGYIEAKDILITEKLTTDIINSIINVIIKLNGNDLYTHQYNSLQEKFYTHHLNKSLIDYKDKDYIVEYIISTKVWHLKLSALEFVLGVLRYNYYHVFEIVVKKLNQEFERHNFGYRIIDGLIVPVSDEEEILSIEEALSTTNLVRNHLNTALEHLSAGRPDYRNSIKESISAVECSVRALTGKGTLGEALKCLPEKGITLPNVLKKSFETLYGYTNDKETGIRHALMEDTNKPGSDEATFMLVACSAFINYLNKKQAH